MHDINLRHLKGLLKFVKKRQAYSVVTLNSYIHEYKEKLRDHRKKGRETREFAYTCKYTTVNQENFGIENFHLLKFRRNIFSSLA